MSRFLPEKNGIPPKLEAAYDFCLAMARGHYENFPVVSLFLPQDLRPHVAALYAFARTADDYADEIPLKPVRIRKLARFRRDLRKALAKPLGRKPRLGTPAILAAVAATRDMCRLPSSELYRLLDAFEHDARERGYADISELNRYCRNSACSVGRLLLALFGVDDPKAIKASDALCTALQYTNFWQDLSRDIPRGRITLPRREAKKAGISLVPGHIMANAGLSKLLEALTTATERLYERAAPLPRLVPKPLARQVRLTLAGGQMILGKSKSKGNLLLFERPRISWTDIPVLLWSALTA